MKNIKITKKNLLEFFYLFYIICFTSYNRSNYFLDVTLIKVSSILLFTFTIILYYKNIKISLLLKWFIVFWIFYYLSLCWTISKPYTLQIQAFTFYIFSGLFSLQYIIEDKKDVIRIMRIIIIALIYSLFLIAIRGGLLEVGTERIGFKLGISPNALGMMLAIASLFLFYMIKFDSKNKKIYVVLFLIFSSFCIFTGSRKAFSMLLIGLAFFYLLLSNNRELIRKVIVIIICLVISMVAIMNNKFLYNIIGHRFESMILEINNDSDSTQDWSVKERNFYIENAMQLFKENPILGVGGNGFAGYMDSINYYHVAYSHNNFTELLSTLGLIGFIIYYSLWLKTIIKTKMLLKNNKETLYKLFFVLLVIMIIMDYWNVSYYNVFFINVFGLIVLYGELNIVNENKRRLK